MTAQVNRQNLPVVLAMTGASGSAYGLRLLEVLITVGCDVHLTISPAAARVMQEELDFEVDLSRAHELAAIPSSPNAPQRLREMWTGARPIAASPRPGTVTYHSHSDYAAGIASGSFRTRGMVICPCSLGTLAAVASGISTHLVHRVADVHLKERRKLIVVPRETPLSEIQLENMLRLSRAGAVILPAMPGLYHRPNSLMDLIDFVVARICDQLDVEVALSPRWGEGR